MAPENGVLIGADVAKPKLDQRSQRDFLSHIFNKAIVRLGTRAEYRARWGMLDELRSDVDGGAYAPRRLQGFLAMPRSFALPRFVPIFSVRDYALFFACVRAIDECSAAEAVEGTFGGWSLGGRRRKREAEFAEAIIDPGPYAESVYRRDKWFENWQQYWRLLAATTEDAAPRSCILSLDIANFYDSISLSRLERQLRSICADSEEAIEVLMFFLQSWNRRLDRYAPASKGLPNDTVGDCARVLANLYLVPFDRAFRKDAENIGARYIRFADDITVVCPNRRKAEQLLFLASHRLYARGLHVNQSKVRFQSKREFERYWRFDIFDRLDQREIVASTQAVQRAWRTPGFGRRETVFKYLLNALEKRPDLIPQRRWVHARSVESRERMSSMTDRQLQRLVVISDVRTDTLRTIARTLMRSPVNGLHLNLLNLLKRFERDPDPAMHKSVSHLLDSLNKINDPIVQMAIRNYE